jgi:hypothetical protein
MSTRMSLIELDDTPTTHTPAQASTPIAPVIVAAVAASTFDAPVMAAPARVAEIERGQAALVASGIAVGGEFFPVGTIMAESGQIKARTEARRVEALPNAREELARFAGAIKLEGRGHRRDLPLNGLRASPDGRMIAIGHPGADAPIVIGTPTRTAWDHVADRLAAHAGSPGLRSYLPGAPLAVREAVVHAHASQVPADVRVSVGTRERVADWRAGKAHAATGQIMRVAGPRYLPIDPGATADAIAAHVPASWKAEITYTGESWSIDVLDGAPMRPLGDAAVGDVFSVGLRAKGNDVREGRFTLHTYAKRWRCLNGTVLESSGRTNVSRIHAGNLTDGQLRGQVRDAMRQHAADVAYFTEAWADARRSRILDTGTKPADAFNALIDAGLIDLPGKRADVVGALVSAWEQEPGYSRADLANAVTRAAHEHAAWWNDLDVSTEAERQGSALIYVRDLSVR